MRFSSHIAFYVVIGFRSAMSSDPIAKIESAINQIGKEESMKCSNVFADLLRNTAYHLEETKSEGLVEWLLDKENSNLKKLK